MLKISENIEFLTRPREGVVAFGDDSRVGRDGSELHGKKTGDDEVDDEVDNEVEKKNLKTSKFKNLFKKLSKSKKTMGSDFISPKVKLAFTELRQTFFKAPILHHFDPRRHIWIEINASGYTISGVLSQLS